MSVRYVMLALESPFVRGYIDSTRILTRVACGLALFLALLALKMALGVGLILYSRWAQRREMAREAPAPASLALPSDSAPTDAAAKASNAHPAPSTPRK